MAVSANEVLRVARDLEVRLSRIPKDRELIERLGCSRRTLYRRFEQLETTGKINRNPSGRGIASFTPSEEPVKVSADAKREYEQRKFARGLVRWFHSGDQRVQHV